jgi:hypothetical protein
VEPAVSRSTPSLCSRVPTRWAHRADSQAQQLRLPRRNEHACMVELPRRLRCPSQALRSSPHLQIGGNPTTPPLLPYSLTATPPRSRARHCREENRDPPWGEIGITGGLTIPGYLVIRGSSPHTPVISIGGIITSWTPISRRWQAPFPLPPCRVG